MRATPRKEIVKKIVVDLAIDEDTVNDVLSFAFSRALKAFKTGNSVELSGFGKFVFNQWSAKRMLPVSEKSLAKMEKTREEHLHLPKYVEYMDILISQKKEAIEDLKRRMDDKLEACAGGMEKSHSSSGEPEGIN